MGSTETIAPTVVADRTWLLPAATGSSLTSFTQCYLLTDDDGGVIVIDPGEDTPFSVDHLGAGLHSIGRSLADITTVLATHFHHDHLGAARRVADQADARLVVHEIEQESIHHAAHPAPAGPRVSRWGVPAEWHDRIANSWFRAADTIADTLVTDGALLEAPGRRLRVRWTPGHTEGHLVIVDEDQGLLFAGDHVLPSLNPGFGERVVLTEHPLTSYLGSLEKTAALDVQLVLPGHGDPFTNLAERCDQIAKRHLARAAEIGRRLDEDGPLTVWDLATRLHWSIDWETILDSVKRSALAQVDLHVERLGRQDELVIA